MNAALKNLQDAGVRSIPMLRAMAHLATNPDTPVTSLAGFAGVTAAAATQLADRLVTLGLATEAFTRHDRRLRLITLTGRGVALAAPFTLPAP